MSSKFETRNSLSQKAVVFVFRVSNLQRGFPHEPS